MTGIYIHVPFCLRKCPYCDFYSRSYSPELAESYVSAAKRSISAYSGMGITADTVYFGGGTPSLLTPGQVSEILDSISDSVTLCSPEITLEANPSSISSEKLCGWRSAGVNRLSIGFQSADDAQLGFLGRLHDTDRACRAVLDASAAGFDNISCDLMIGLKGQDSASLDRTLDRMLSLPVSHLSAYMLKIEQGTAFDTDEVRSSVPDDDTVSDMYLQLCGRMSAAGYEHYEISNWAKNGRRSRHNMKYWTLEPYIGIGPAAHSDLGGKRFYCPADITQFASSKVQKTVQEDDHPDRTREYVMLGLRLSDGITRERLSQLGGKDFADSVFSKAAPLVNNGLMTISGDRAALTEQGFLLSNAVILHLLG